MRALLLSLLCVGPAWGRLCQDNTFWSNEQDRCLPCTVCAPGDQQLLSCQPFQDTICQPSPRRVPPPPPTEEEVHRARLEEERARATQARAVETLQVERTRLETLVYEWQTTVFVVSILVTFALVFSFLAVLLRRTRTAIRKGELRCSSAVHGRGQLVLSMWQRMARPKASPRGSS